VEEEVEEEGGLREKEEMTDKDQGKRGWKEGNRLIKN
jgi:hypothetical protein